MYSQQEIICLKNAAQILENKISSNEYLTSAEKVIDYCRYSIAHYEHEVFFVLFLNNQHQLIESCELFRGTIDSASIYPREVVKEALFKNASAIIFAHNHPSGSPEPSESDRSITSRLQQALELVDIKVLDHIIVGSHESVSFAQRGLI